MTNFLVYDDTSSSTTSSSWSDLLKKPALWIVVGVIVGLALAWYFWKRFIKAKDNYAIIVLKHGEIENVISNNEGDLKSKYLVPFIETSTSPIQLKGNVISNDKLMINDGPDKLYKITFKMVYDVKDVKTVYKTLKDQNVMTERLNDCLRAYAYAGNVETIIKKYVEGEKELVKVINKEFEVNGIEVQSFKILSIAPHSA